MSIAVKDQNERSTTMQLSIKSSLALHCLIVISEFGDTQKVTSEKLALSTGTNPAAIRSIMSALKKDGIINIKSGTGGATLNFPPQEITVYRVCNAVKPEFCKDIFHVHAKPSQYCPVGRNIHNVLQSSYEKFETALAESLKTVTLADIIRDYHAQLEQEN